MMLRIGWCFATLVMLNVSEVPGQSRHEADVVYIAGPNVYLDVGRTLGVAASDTLLVERGVEELGRWITISTSSSRSVIRSIDGFELRVGEKISVTVPEKQFEQERAVPDVSIAARPASVMDISARSTGANNRTDRVRVTGSIGAGLVASQSRINAIGSDADPIERIYAAPSVSLNLRVRDRGSSLVSSVRMRATGRFDGDTSEISDRRLLLYSASVEKQLAPSTHVTAGRFAGRIGGSGFFDGISVKTENGLTYAGAAVGVQPSRYYEGFSTDLPKYSLFAGLKIPGDAFRYKAGASFTDVRGRNGYMHHLVFATDHVFRAGDSFVRMNGSVGRDPVDKSWKLLRMRSTASAAIAKFRLSIDQDRIRSYSYWSVAPIPTDNRIRTGASLTYSPRAQSYSVGWSRSQYGARQPYNAVHGRVNLHRLPAGMSFQSSLSHWQSNATSGLALASSVGLRVSRSTLRMSHRFSSTHVGEQSIRSHTISPSLSARAGARLRFFLQGSYLTGRSLRSKTLITSMTIRI